MTNQQPSADEELRNMVAKEVFWLKYDALNKTDKHYVDRTVEYAAKEKRALLDRLEAINKLRRRRIVTDAVEAGINAGLTYSDEAIRAERDKLV